jgi:hypothetical protein
VSTVSPFGPLGMFDAFGPIGPLSALSSSGLEVPQGNPGAVSDAAGDLNALAGALDEQGQTITSAAHTASGWEGSASSAFGTYSGHLVGVCSGNAAACKDAAAALLTFSAALAHAQAVTSQAVGDFNTAASAYTQHRSAASSAALAAQTARLNAASAADPATHEGYQRTASSAEQEQAGAQKAAATAQATAEAAQQRGQQALAAYEQDVKTLATQLQTATARLKPAPALPGTHAAAPKGGGSLLGAVLPIVGIGVLDGVELFFSGGGAGPALPEEDAALLGADAATTGATDEAAAGEKLLGPGVDRGDGRDILGKFAGKTSYGADDEAAGLDQYEAATGEPVIRDQVRATLPDGSTRLYDGLIEKPDGTYEGLEVKGPTASTVGRQVKFDGQVDGGTAATARLGGKTIKITSTAFYRVTAP